MADTAADCGIEVKAPANSTRWSLATDASGHEKCEESRYAKRRQKATI